MIYSTFHIYTQPEIWGFSILPKDTSVCRLEEPNQHLLHVDHWKNSEQFIKAAGPNCLLAIQHDIEGEQDSMTVTVDRFFFRP